MTDGIPGFRVKRGMTGTMRRSVPPPPLSGREEASQPRHEGEECLSAASSAAPEGGASRRATKPDNSGGASWFVLLAAEKNEHLPALHPGVLWIPHQVRNDRNDAYSVPLPPLSGREEASRPRYDRKKAAGQSPAAFPNKRNNVIISLPPFARGCSCAPHRHPHRQAAR